METWVLTESMDWDSVVSMLVSGVWSVVWVGGPAAVWWWVGCR